uniref:c-Myc-binding protein n=1 Tax=Anopheles christyi TaxID=43041 RepID=A0A182JS10_9DIPT
MGNYKPIDLSKEEFRKYLDRQGVLDAITQVLVKCNSERPENALTFVLENMSENYVPMKTQLQEAHEEIERLKSEISVLKASGEIQQEPACSTPENTSVADTVENKIDNAPQINGAVEAAGADGVTGEKEIEAATTPSTTTEAGGTDSTPKVVLPAPSNEVADTASSASTGNEASDAKKEPNATTAATTENK